MGRTSKQRRSTKQHKQSARLRAHIDDHTGSPNHLSAADMAALINAGARAAHGPIADEATLDRVVDAIASAASNDRFHAEATLSTELARVLVALYEAGWQPLDVAHVVRQQATTRVARLLHQAIAVEADATNAADRAPAEWVDQLASLNRDVVPPAPGSAIAEVVTGWRHRDDLGLAEGLYDGLKLLGIVQQLPRLTPIGPRPSQWATYRRLPTSGRTSAADPKMLARIRALLAKAEGTTFEAEAEAFTAKAQDLMTRHAIDSAVLLAAGEHDLRSDVVARRVHIDNPYAAEKVDLLAVVCGPNGVRTVWHQGLGFATVVGLPVDLDVAELLFTSLLVQVNRAMTDATATAHSRSRGFRRAFMIAYAHRIGERLDEATQQANHAAMAQYGTALVPVLAARSEAVDAEFTRLFPSTRATRGRRLDAHGWAAGRAAADQAVLDEGRTRLHP